MKTLRLIGLAAGLSLGLTAAASAADITIGVAGPLTGQYASFGQQFKNGATLAIEDINKAGGVLGKKLAMNMQDDACDPKQARAVAEKLVGAGVPVVIGHFCSGSSIPASDVYTDAGVIEITPASTNPKFTERGKWDLFRVCGRDDQQGKVAGDYILKHYKGKNVAIVHDKQTYSQGLADEVKKTINAGGMKEKMYESFGKDDKDFNALVSRMKANKIDVVYVGGYHTSAGLMLRQMRAQGLMAQMISGDALATQEFWSITGDAGAGMMFTFGPDPTKRPAAAKVVESFKAKNINPEGYTLYTYAAIQIWSQAANKAKTTDPRKVAAEIHKGTWDTVLGPISYDKKGDITRLDYVFYVWKKGGKYEEMAQ